MIRAKEKPRKAPYPIKPKEHESLLWNVRKINRGFARFSQATICCADMSQILASKNEVTEKISELRMKCQYVKCDMPAFFCCLARPGPTVTTGTVPIVTKTRENVTTGTVPVVTHPRHTPGLHPRTRPQSPVSTAQHQQPSINNPAATVQHQQPGINNPASTTHQKTIKQFKKWR